MFKHDVVHAGLTCTANFMHKMNIRVLLEPPVGLYYISSVFKERTLCGTILTGYFLDGVFVDEETNRLHPNSVQEIFIGISYRRGERPVVYADDNMFRSMPACIFSQHDPGTVNCPICIDHTKYPIWELGTTEL
jgi:hypothetical protein